MQELAGSQPSCTEVGRAQGYGWITESVYAILISEGKRNIVANTS